MAPVDQYLMEDRESELALARGVQLRRPSHAPPRSWFLDVTVTRLRFRARTASFASWNVPGHLQSTTRFLDSERASSDLHNAAAVRSYLPRTIKKTDLILAGRTKALMIEAIVAAIDKRELSAMEPRGAGCDMVSKREFVGRTKSRPTRMTSYRRPGWPPQWLMLTMVPPFTSTYPSP